MAEIHYSEIVKIRSQIVRDKGIGRARVGFLMFSPSTEGIRGAHKSARDSALKVFIGVSYTTLFAQTV